MRQWLADPRKMCSSHINGEHAEAHSFLSKMRQGHDLTGFIEGKMLFGAEYVKARHDLLAIFLPNHSTPLDLTDKIISAYPLTDVTMDSLKESLGILLSRCDDCLKKHTG